MSEPNVTATLTIKGKDDASAALRSAATSAGELGKNLKKASEQAGAFDHGLPGLQGKHDSFNRLAAAVGGAGGALQEATHGIALLDAALRLIPGPVGATIAILGGAAASILLLEKHARQARAALEQAFSGDILQGVSAAKTRFDLTTDAAVALGRALADSGRSAQDVRDDLIAVVNRAEEVGQDGSAAVAKFAESLVEGVTQADRLRNRIRMLGVEVSKLDFGAALYGAGVDSGKSLEDADKALGALGKTLEDQNRRLADLSKGRAGPLAEFHRQTTLLQRLTGNGRGSEKAVAAQNAAIEAQRAKVTAAKEALREFEQRQQSALEALKEAGQAEAQIRQQEAQREIQDAEEHNSRLLRQQQEAEARKRKAAAADAARRRAAAAALRTRQGAEFMTGLESDIEAQAARNLEIAKAEAQAAQEGARQYEAMRDRVLGVYAELATDPARKAALEIQQIEIDKARELAAVKEQMHLTSAQQAELSAAIEAQALERVRLKQVEVNQAVASQVQAWAGAGQAIAQALGVGDEAQRVSAGLQALVAGADAFKYAAAGNIPSAIASGAAALGYARAAVAPAPPLPGGGGAAQRAPVPAAATSTAPQGVTINLHGIATSKAEVGAGIAKALKAAKPTGFVPFGVPA